MNVPVVVRVLQAHGMESIAVAELGCGAVWNLAVCNPANRAALGAAGACEGK